MTEPALLTKTASGLQRGGGKWDQWIGTGEWGGRHSGWLPWILLIGICLLVYHQVIWAVYIWDDQLWLTDNRLIRRPDGLWYIWTYFSHGSNSIGGAVNYYPMVFTSFWIEYHLYQFLLGTEYALHPVLYHASNLLVHIGAVVICWRALLKLKIPGAWWVALFFAIQPMQVESVAWVAERKNTLSGLFFFATIYFYEIYRQRSVIRPQGLWKYYLAVVLCCAAAIFSKGVMCTTPAILLVTDWWKGRLNRQSWTAILPILISGLILAFFIAHQEATMIGVSGDDFNFTWMERVLIAGRVLWFYAYKLIWPWPLLQMYPRWNIDIYTWWQYLFPLGALAVVAILWFLRNRIGRGPIAAVAAYIIAASPSLGFVNYYSMIFGFAFDHYQYTSCISLLALLVGILIYLTDRLPSMRKMISTNRVIVLVIPVALIYGITSFNVTQYYLSGITLWKQVVTHNPDAWMAQTMLGIAYMDEKEDYTAAVEALERSERNKIYPDNQFNLAVAHEFLGHAEKAEAYYQSTLTIAPKNNNALAGLAHFLERQKRSEEATEYYRRAMENQPLNPERHYQLAVNLAAINHKQEAEKEYWETIRLNPLDLRARYNLGNLLLDKGNYFAAIEHYTVVLKNGATPDAMHNMAFALYKLGRTEEALTLRKQAEELEKQQKAVPEKQTASE